MKKGVKKERKEMKIRRENELIFLLIFRKMSDLSSNFSESLGLRKSSEFPPTSLKTLEK